MSSNPLVVQGVSKAYGPTTVLHHISLELLPGTATALAGENGAGKSTLMKIVSGLEVPDTGEVILNGVPLTHPDPRQVRASGVSLVPQELAPVLDLRVYENIFLGREILSPLGLLQRKRMADETRALLDEFGVKINPEWKVRQLPVGMRQLVEIVKAVSTGSTMLLLDEPTSALSARETARLFEVLEKLKEKGVAFLYTTHRMEEIRQFSNRVVVLRDGELILDSPIDDVTDDEIITQMVGRKLESMYPDVAPATDEVALSIRDLWVEGAHGPVSLDVRRGEIVGLAGMVGAGRSELLETIFNHRSFKKGAVTVNGRKLRKHTVQASIRGGMGFVPEDRKHEGLVLLMNILDNASLPGLPKYSRFGFLQNTKRKRDVSAAMTQVNLKSSGILQGVDRLSGGNQQKVVLGRWLTGGVNVLLLDEPTRGVDVGARSEIYRLIAGLAASGMAVVMASSDMGEVLGLSHRIEVMHEGMFAGEITGDDLKAPDVQDRIYRLATGY